MDGLRFQASCDSQQHEYGDVREVPHTGGSNGSHNEFYQNPGNSVRFEYGSNGAAHSYPEQAEIQVGVVSDSGYPLEDEFQQNAEVSNGGEAGEVDALAEQVQNIEVSEAECCRVRVACTFSPMLFLGEDLYQQKRVRSMIYRYDDSYFRELDLEDLSLDMIVLVVDDDGVDFERAIVSEIKRIGISVDGLDYFGIKAVSSVYECPEEIQEERPAVRKYSLKAAPVKEPLMRGQRLKLICDPTEGDYVVAELVE